MTAGRRLPLLALLLASVLCGCRHSNQSLENELRAKESLYRDAVAELKHVEAQNDALMRELGAIRHSTGPVLPPEIAGPTFGLKRISLGRGTGGYDNDGLPGDEALQVVVEPRDTEDHVVKVPGSLHITAIEVNPQGLKRPICWWSFTPEQLRPLWKQSLFSNGYIILVPWTAFPHSENVRVVAQFKLTDDRVFEADKDVKVRLLPFTPHAPSPVPTPTGGNPLIIPTRGTEAGPALRWSPSPLTGAVEIGRPEPLTGPPAPPSIFGDS
jgi:hypothetical protein